MTNEADEQNTGTPPECTVVDDDATPDVAALTGGENVDAETTFEELPGGGYRVTRRKVTTHRVETDEHIDEQIEEHLPASAYRAPLAGDHPAPVG